MLLCIGLLLALSHTCFAGDYQVTRVIDGDTLVVTKGSVKLTIRLVGIDALRFRTRNMSQVSHSASSPRSTLQDLY
jgi:endonuclease YncB( thermonuclease family)